MIDFLKDALRFIWRRDSESATLLMIGLGNWLIWKHAKEMGDYFLSLADLMHHQGKYGSVYGRQRRSRQTQS